MLMEPDRISIRPDEIIDIHSVNEGRAFDPLLLPVDKDRHMLPMSSPFLCSFSRS
jgi:hypothetical protein